MNDKPQYRKKDFISDQEVRWCPGCGDYAILSAVQMAMAEIGKPRDQIVFVSGIGCSSRFPYYMNTYGMHTIHGRAIPIASGVKLQNEDLSVWIATGDGDALSIGGNHFIHALRRNMNLNIILFNNEIYGLTKGQYSPLSKKGSVTKSTPYGSLDRPFNSAALPLGSGSTFFARTIDTDPKHLKEMVIAADAHEGTSIIEVFQNCVIYTNKLHDAYTNRLTRDDNTLRLEHGKPMIFGKNKNKGLICSALTPQVVTIGENGVTEADLLVHDVTANNNASMLSSLKFPEFPIPLGVYRQVEEPVYDDDLVSQIQDVVKEKGRGDMQKLLDSGDTWEIK
ncbi:MAG: 2-oxoacid:ferredoxin oxidoreductase subunit beta [Bacteriovoracaceae bacterium]|nr:2-oxoacid:ferredoxin oxidoreductase subunit beta [Bacteriovoracaceae bacterium]